MDSREMELFLSKVPLFSGLSPEERKAVASTTMLRRFAENQTIVQEEDSGNQSFFLIVSGTVNVVVFTSEGKQTVLATLRKGDFFGEMALLDGEPRSASVIAAEECGLLMIYRRNFMNILRKYPDIAIQMLGQISRRLRKANRHISTLSLMSVYGRIADVLVQIGQEQGRKIAHMTVIDSRPTHQAIAARAGASRETVSRILAQLQKKGYISIDRKQLVIHDAEKLCD